MENSGLGEGLPAVQPHPDAVKLIGEVGGATISSESAVAALRRIVSLYLVPGDSLVDHARIIGTLIGYQTLFPHDMPRVRRKLAVRWNSPPSQAHTAYPAEMAVSQLVSTIFSSVPMDNVHIRTGYHRISEALSDYFPPPEIV